MRKPTKKDRERWASYWGKRQGDGYAYKTACTQAVLEAFGVTPDRYRYAQCVQDVQRILSRFGWRVTAYELYRSRITVGQIRGKIKRGEYGEGTFVVRVPGHVILIDGEGDTFVDTDNRRRDKRWVTHLLTVSKPEN